MLLPLQMIVFSENPQPNSYRRFFLGEDNASANIGSVFFQLRWPRIPASISPDDWSLWFSKLSSRLITADKFICRHTYIYVLVGSLFKCLPAPLKSLIFAQNHGQGNIWKKISHNFRSSSTSHFCGGLRVPRVFNRANAVLLKVQQTQLKKLNNVVQERWVDS